MSDELNVIDYNTIDYNNYTDEQLQSCITQLQGYANEHTQKAQDIDTEVNSIDTTQDNMKVYVASARNTINRLNRIVEDYNSRIAVLQAIIDDRAKEAEKEQATANYSELDAYCQTTYGMTIVELILKMKE
jgi:hypothetical protein